MVERNYDGEDICISEGMYLHLHCPKNPAGRYDIILIEGKCMAEPQETRGVCLREGLTRKELDDLLTDKFVEDIFDQADRIFLETELWTSLLF